MNDRSAAKAAVAILHQPGRSLVAIFDRTVQIASVKLLVTI